MAFRSLTGIGMRGYAPFLLPTLNILERVCARCSTLAISSRLGRSFRRKLALRLLADPPLGDAFGDPESFRAYEQTAGKA
jgi:hypothetical protein